MRISTLLPDTIAARTLLVLVVGLTVSHLASVSLYFSERSAALEMTGGEHVAERIATIALLLDGATEDERQRIVELVDRQRLEVTWGRASAVEGGAPPGREADILASALARHLGDGPIRVFRLGYDAVDQAAASRATAARTGEEQSITGLMRASVQLRDGSWVNFAAPVSAPEPFWSIRFALSMATMLTAVSGLSLLVVRRLTAPLKAFGGAAADLGRNVAAPPIVESGPDEVRHAVRAFNEMQARIRRFVEDRTRMLAAIAHDLGTPITRLRLRAEFVDDPEQRRKMLADLDDMEKMVFASLSFAREDTAAERRELTDLRSLVARVCDDAVDAGQDVTASLGGAPVRFSCQPTALRRALANLIDNAVKYGKRATVTLKEEQGHVLILVDDLGPGIDPGAIEDAFRPFRRLEGSRNRETGGTGLGLAVARTIVRAHGGDIALGNRPEGGLRAAISLPRA